MIAKDDLLIDTAQTEGYVSAQDDGEVTVVTGYQADTGADRGRLCA